MTAARAFFRRLEAAVMDALLGHVDYSRAGADTSQPPGPGAGHLSGVATPLPRAVATPGSP